MPPKVNPREKFYDEREVLESVPDSGPVDNPARRFLLDTARSAKDASALVRDAWAKYRSPVDYGITELWEVLAGRQPGRMSAASIMFCTPGIMSAIW